MTFGCADPEIENISLIKTDDGLSFEQEGQSVCPEVRLTPKSDGSLDLRTKYYLYPGGLMLSDSDEISGTWILDGDLFTICENMDSDAIDISRSNNRIVLTEFDNNLEGSLSLSLEKEQNPKSKVIRTTLCNSFLYMNFQFSPKLS